ncbi:probable methyltransferase-like protein 25 isoform X2 [Watersipora subatra]|uniref:probable methyltransferase-like protein 25 isoform X2 n=1 Tax=Watersipora subatra TaxID=2589382 RepID=UPI00355C4D4A
METRKQELLALCRADLQLAADFLSKYLALANLHNTNFIINNYWNQVPQSIKDSLESLPGTCMSGLLMKDEWQKENKEAHSQTWKSTASSLPPQKVGSNLLTEDPDFPLVWQHTDLQHYMSEAASFHMNKLSYPRQCEEIYSLYFNKAAHRSDPFVSHSMGEKKCHEVELMAEVASQVARHSQVNKIVDLGSGKGYLATTLVMQYGYNVIGIDSQEGNTHGAMQRKQRLEKQYTGLVEREVRHSATKQKAWEATEKNLQAVMPDETETRKHSASSPSYKAITAYVSPEDDLEKYIGDVTCAGSECMLTGLHTCGNLAVSMAKLFLKTPSCKAMLNVGCCYHQVDEMFASNPFAPQEDCLPHFPLSSVLIQRSFKLGRNCRMLSMQAMEKSAVSGVGGGGERSLFWRALLQQILLDMHGYWSKEWIVGKISAKCSDFTEYVYKALKRLKLDHSMLSPSDINAYLEKYKESEKQMPMFFQLRIALSPCIESIILLDRCLYLMEQESTDVVLAKRLFDPVQSPRCYGIIANKKHASLVGGSH